MIRLFIKVCLLMCLLGFVCKWSFYWLLEGQVFTDRDRLISGTTEVHIGVMRVIASELTDLDLQVRSRRWQDIQEDLSLPIEIRPLAELSKSQQDRLRSPKGFIFDYRDAIIDYLGVPLDREFYLRLGPIADRTEMVIENEVADWLKILAHRISETSDAKRLLEDISLQCGTPVQLQAVDTLPMDAQQSLKSGSPTAFYSLANDYYVAMPLENRKELLSLGPLPKVKDWAVNTFNDVLGMFFAMVIGTCGWLVYEVSQKFRRIEVAAKKIAEGYFDARVDESIAGESRVLANAFNRMASKTESSIRAKNELLQMVSHELRTPLSRIRFAVELLDVSKNEQLKSSRMQILRQSIDDLDRIVDEVLDYVRNDDVEVEKVGELIEIRTSLDQIISVYQLEHPKLRFEWVSSEQPQLTEVYADRILLQRVISNLLSNAVRFAKSVVRIHVYLAVDPNRTDRLKNIKNKMVCIEIEDDGPGIPEEKRREIFSPFVRLTSNQAPPSTMHDEFLRQSPVVENDGHDSELYDKISHAGLGLGLAIVERILEQHGGSVCVDQGHLGGCVVRTFWPVPQGEFDPDMTRRV